MVNKKLFFYSLALLSLILFAYNSYSFISGFKSIYTFELGKLDGFGDTGEGNPQFDQLIKLFAQKIVLYKNESIQLRNWAMWVNLGVTALSAASTLVTSLKAVKSSEIQAGFIRTVAVLAFLGTLASWANGQLTDRKNQADQNLQRCRDERITFLTLYNKGTSNDERNELVRLYVQKLDDF